jgi:2-polyprenyl-3-methyl-5-hydroxy-6-metoxy-1,4-benzoquinol methylase
MVKQSVWSSQGVHIDPAEAPAEATGWHPDRTAAFHSPEMETYRSTLRIDDLDVRESILHELADYHGISADEALKRCLHWEDWSVEEWKSRDRSTEEGIRDFYNTVQSWTFDLMWYAYLQVTGHAFSASVAAARFAMDKAIGEDYLDFGSGTGTTAQLFSRLGFRTTMADISIPLLDYASWRLALHGDHSDRIDLNTESLPTDAYDFITALDTLVHVPDFDETARDLRRAIRTGGYLLANFDVRKKDDHGSLWHLHNDLHVLDHRLRAAGFVRTHKLAELTCCYVAVDTTRPSFKVATALDTAALPLRRAKKRGRDFIRSLRDSG